MQITIYDKNKKIIDYIEMELPTGKQDDDKCSLEQRIVLMTNSIFSKYMMYFMYRTMYTYFKSLSIGFRNQDEKIKVAESILKIKNKLRSFSVINLTEMLEVVPLHILYKYAFINAIVETIEQFKMENYNVLSKPEKFIEYYLYKYCVNRILIENYIDNTEVGCIYSELRDIN